MKTRNSSAAKVLELEVELEALFARRAVADTACIVAGEDLPEVAPEETEARLQIERKRAANATAGNVLDLQIETQAAELRDLDVALADAWLRLAGAERRAASDAIKVALDGVAAQVARLSAVDQVQTKLLDHPFRFTWTDDPLAVISGTWLGKTLLTLPPEIRPGSFEPERHEIMVQKQAAEILDAIGEQS